jgi:predicted O-linked N-acetylglucosamine transferase (SPINDLY family)
MDETQKFEMRQIFQKAYSFHQQGDLVNAQILYKQVLSIDPNHFEALNLLGVIEAKNKNTQAAISLLEKAIAVQPNNAVSYYNYGLLLKDVGQLAEADRSYSKAISLNPNFAEAYFNNGNVLRELARTQEAINCYQKAVALKPNYVEAFSNLGSSLEELMQVEKALHAYKEAIRLKPDYAEAHSNFGNALQKLERYEEALASYDRAISIHPLFAEAHYNRGIALKALKQTKEAVSSYKKAIEIQPSLVDAYSNLGNALKELKQFEEAVDVYQEAIRRKPNFAEAYSNLGVTLHELKRMDEAIACYNKAISIKTDYAEALCNKGLALHELERYEDAIESYDQAISFKEDYADAFFNKGLAFKARKQDEQAIESFQQALKFNPEQPYIDGTLLFTKLLICKWDDYANSKKLIEDKVREKQKAAPTFALLAITESLLVQKLAAELWIDEKYPPNDLLGPIPKYDRNRKIKIAYFSADFKEHPVAYLTAEMFELHDKDKFELIAFNFAPIEQKEMQIRIANSFDQFIQAQHMSDLDVAKLSRKLKVDIAIDLTGITKGHRVGVFAMRAAPIQLSYLGYLGTMGATYYDYLIADKILIPEESQHFYAEKIIYLPSYQVNDSQRNDGDVNFTKKELGLPESGFVFCCFNNNYKISPSTFQGWMRILLSVPDSVLFIYAENSVSEKNLKKEAQQLGVESSRLIFGARLNRSAYLARYKLADLFLDTFPYNAGTTASDALWMGLPVLTCMGESFASRMAASLLTALDMPELITKSQFEYESLAVELATNSAKMHSIKYKLHRKMYKSRLFNTFEFTRKIEQSYVEIYEKNYANLLPDHITIMP